jgi:hypothetical protein
VWGTIDLATDNSASAKTLPGARYLFIIGLFVLGCVVLVQGLQRRWELNAELHGGAPSHAENASSAGILLNEVVADDDADEQQARYDGESSEGHELDQLQHHTGSGHHDHASFNLPHEDGDLREPAKFEYAPVSANSAE